MSSNSTAAALLPDAFCWTKYGAEAGEPAERILERKERERSANRGTFLWGIGNSLRPSIVDLLGHTSEPSVCFSPMRSQPAAADIDPASLSMWHAGVGLDGSAFVVPEHSVVTSRAGLGRRGARHFALVCSSVEPIQTRSDAPLLALDELENLRTGSPLGTSQVTSVVRYRRHESDVARKYVVNFVARLAPPYFVVLTDRTVVPTDVRSEAQADARGAWHRLLEFKRSVAPTDSTLLF